MTPEQKIKATIMAKANYPKPFSDKNYDEFIENDSYWHEEEFRCSGVETGLPCESDRNLESCSVAAQMFDGSWVGWTYWYGGGKHGYAESIEWMSEAYEVESWEEMQLVRKFKKSP